MRMRNGLLFYFNPSTSPLNHFLTRPNSPSVSTSNMVGEQYHKSIIICTAKYSWFAAVSVHPYLKDRKEDLNEEEKETAVVIIPGLCYITHCIKGSIAQSFQQMRLLINYIKKKQCWWFTQNYCDILHVSRPVYEIPLRRVARLTH